MAEEQLGMPNMPSSGASGRGAVASVKAAAGAVKGLLGTVKDLEAALKRMETSSAKIAANLKATGSATNTANGGVGASQGNGMQPASFGGSTARPKHTPNVGFGPATGLPGWPIPVGAPANFGGGMGAKIPIAGTTGKIPTAGEIGPGTGQGFFRGGEAKHGFLGEQLKGSAAFYAPQLIGKAVNAVTRFSGGAYDDDIIANRFAVGTTFGGRGYGGMDGAGHAFKSGMYTRMADALGRGAYSAADRQQAAGTLEQNFTTKAIFGNGGGVAGGGRGGGSTIAGQVTALSQAIPGLGAAGAAGQMASMNRPQVVNMARAFGVQVRDKNGGVNYERVANGLLDRIFGSRRNLNPDQIAYAFEPGNSAYYDLSNMGFDDEAIQIIKRIAMGRAQAGWSTRANLSDTKAGKEWRKKAGLDDNVTEGALKRSGEQQRLKSKGTSGAVAGIDAANDAASGLADKFNDLIDSSKSLQAIFKSMAATGGFAGALPGNPGGDASGIGSGVLHGATAGLGYGAQFMGMSWMAKRAAARAAGSAGPGVIGRAGPALLAGLGGGAAVGMGAAALGAGALVGGLTNYGLGKAGVHNKWAKAGGSALTGAGAGAALGGTIGAGFFGVGAVPGALIGGALGGIGGGIAGLFAAGGMVPGDHNNDTVHIKATPGEVVVPRHTVSKHGGASELMRKLGFSGAGRDGDGYAKGGEVNYGGEVTGNTSGLNADFLTRLRAFSAAVGAPFNVGSGYRSLDQQAKLYADWRAHKPGQAKAAPPGKSNHNYGLAVDGPHWAGKHPEKYGLRYPMSYEPWHIEPTNAKQMRGGAQIAAGSDGRDVGAMAVTGGGGSSSVPNAFFQGAFATSSVAIMRNFGAGTAVVADNSPAAAGGTGGTGTATAPTNPKGNIALAKSLAASKGWTGTQWDALYALWNQESGFKTNAGSPAHAYGIPQALPGSKMGDHGKDWMTNPKTQILWGMDYISGRYGDPIHAQEHKRKTDSRLGSSDAHAQPGGWYSAGAWETKDEVARLHQGEMVIPAKVADGVRTALREHGAGIRSGGGGGAVVTINVTLQNASNSEARRLAGVVKQHLEMDDDLSQVAMS